MCVPRARAEKNKHSLGSSPLVKTTYVPINAARVFAGAARVRANNVPYETLERITLAFIRCSFNLILFSLVPRGIVCRPCRVRCALKSVLITSGISGDPKERARETRVLRCIGGATSVCRRITGEGPLSVVYWRVYCVHSVSRL